MNSSLTNKDLFSAKEDQKAEADTAIAESSYLLHLSHLTVVTLLNFF